MSHEKMVHWYVSIPSVLLLKNCNCMVKSILLKDVVKNKIICCFSIM